MPEDADTFDATTDSKALRGYKEWCQTPGSFALKQLGPTGTSPYKYLPLNRSDEIRLLTLEPGSGNSMLRCTLEHAFLDDTPPPLYETISYVCGDPPHKRTTMFLHGHKVRVMATSEAALRRMRLRDKPRKLWIDSICINQDDTGERGHQVGIMYKIYSMTSRTLAWLGPYDSTLAESIAAMEAILQEIAVETRGYADFKELVFDRKHGRHIYSKKSLSNTIDPLAFLRLVTNPWFLRLWIVQEVSLAPSSMCYYGEFEVSLISILRSARWLFYKIKYVPEIPDSSFYVFTSSVALFDIADRECGFLWHGNGGSPLAFLLNMLGFMQSFDRRDHVFSILGLWQTLTKVATLPDLLRPDYDLSVCDVFRRGFWYAIEERGDLSPLEWISEPSEEARDDSWPSWVPVIDQDLLDEDRPESLSGSHFNAGNDNPMTVLRDSDGPDDLVVSGVLLDTITEVSRTFSPDITSSDMQTLLEDLERPRGESWIETPAGGLETQISLVLLWGEFREARVTPQVALQSYQSFKAHLNEHRSYPQRPQDLDVDASDEDKSASRYWDEAEGICHHRAIFHTKSGLIGLGPRCSQPGDVVAILYGCRFPMVIRPLPGPPQGSYSLLGVSYVYGIMDGEAVQRHKEMGREDDVFRIV